ncbi:SDR family oxidoreductase [Telluribacter humicola]
MRNRRSRPSQRREPADVAATIAYLASDDAAFVQGAMIQVDGGRSDQL